METLHQQQIGSERLSSGKRNISGPVAVIALLAGAALWRRYGIRWTLLALVPWSAGLVTLAVTDLRHHRLPTRTIYLSGAAAGTALILAAATTDNWARLAAAAVCAVAAAVVFATLWLISPKSLGFGDVRLAALCALMLGWLSPMLAIVGLAAGQLACLFAVAVLAAAKRIHRRSEMPLGTFIAIASLATAITLGR